MLKAEMEKQLREGHKIVSEFILRARNPKQDKFCEYCWQPVGEQHDKRCRLWPFILWRQKNHDEGLFGQEKTEEQLL